MTYDEVGNPVGLARPNGVDTEWLHDTRNRLVNVRTSLRATDATIASYGYGLSASGMRTGILEADGALRSYGCA